MSLISNRPYPRVLVLLLDALIILFSVFLSFELRFNFNIPSNEFSSFHNNLMLIVVARVLLIVVFGVHKGIVRYTSTPDVGNLVLSIGAGTVIFGIVNVFSYYILDINVNIVPRSIILIEFFVTSVLLIGYRLLLRIIFQEVKSSAQLKKNVLIFGAGESGLLTKHTLDKDAGLKYVVLSFIDDDNRKVGKTLENIPIYSASKLEELLSENKVDFLIIAVQMLKSSRKSELTDIALKYKTKVLLVPPAASWINGQLSFKQIKKINIDELLGRDVIVINNDKVSRDLAGKTILVTGAAGSIGSEIVRQLMKYNPLNVVCVDQAETPMFILQNELDSFSAKNCSFHIVDICNRVSMCKIFEKYHPEMVFHAAAYKHVPIMEMNPAEAVRNNIGGTKVIADLAVEFNVAKFVMISTDKAVNPTNIMGASKRIAEIYVDIKNKQSKTAFITTRFGNVLGSNGSVIPLFKKQIENGGPITVTDPNVTRFFMTIPEACSLVLEAGTMGNGGEIFIFDMGESVKIVDLAEKMIKLSGLTLGKDIQIRFTGLRPGEKLYEELLTTEENTLPTYHNRIMIAKVDHSNIEAAPMAIADLLSDVESKKEMDIVAKMKKIVPEFISKNSVYQQLDK